MIFSFSAVILWIIHRKKDQHTMIGQVSAFHSSLETDSYNRIFFQDRHTESGIAGERFTDYGNLTIVAFYFNAFITSPRPESDD